VTRRPEPHRRRRLPVEQAYPRVARWVQGYGWIELGHDDMGRSFVRALDDGGLVWEGAASYACIDDALQALDAALATWLRDQPGE
jgi:hypothetical protein